MDVIKKYFDQEFVMTKSVDEDFENSTKYRICDHNYIDVSL